MSVYILAQLSFRDLDAYRRYQTRFPKVFEKYQGMMLAADERPQVLEGEWDRNKVVLLQFPDEASARRFQESEDYREIARDRTAGADGPVLLVHGLLSAGYA
jgi:uncharacterized protein (DUF1330 family)